MKRILAATLLTLALAPAPASAEVIDLATVKCSDLASMSEEDVSYFFVWLRGYFGGKAGDTTMDLSAVEDAGKTIGAYCGQIPLWVSCPRCSRRLAARRRRAITRQTGVRGGLVAHRKMLRMR